MSSKKKKKQRQRARKCAKAGCVRITLQSLCERCRITPEDVAKLMGVPADLLQR